MGQSTIDYFIVKKAIFNNDLGIIKNENI